MKRYCYEIAGLLGEVDAVDIHQAITLSIADALKGNPPFLNEMETNFQVYVVPKDSYKPRVQTRPAERVFLFYNHHSKGNLFLKALFQPGYRRSGNYSSSRKLAFVMTDQAILGRSGHLADMYDAGTRHFFVYPHTARPNLVNDIVPEFEHITAQFVATPEHANVMRLYGYSKPLHAVGWTFCPIEEFKPKGAPRRVLFAPIHPRCSKVDQDVNAESFERLFRLAKKDDIQLTVRYINRLEDAGLEFVTHPNVEYFQGRLDPDFEQIDETDVVVSHQTFAWIAVARGVPTVMMAEDLPTHIEVLGQEPRYAENWEKYHHLIAYPLDLLAVPKYKSLDILQRAVKWNADVEIWKKRLIGEPFNPERFMEILEGYLDEKI